MRKINAYNNSVWLADGERFEPFVDRAMAQPCPTAKDIAKIHRKAMKAASELLPFSAQMERLRVYGVEAGSGIDDPLLNNDVRTMESHILAGKPLAEAPRAIRSVAGKIGVVNILGPVDQRMSAELVKAGGTPLDWVSAALDSLLGNSSVGAIVLRFDSPGGAISGVEELATKTHDERPKKPIYGHADSLAASAALWLISACSMVIVTPGGNSGVIGSHGVYVMHVNEAEALKKEGYEVSMISAGKNKVEFSPYAPLSNDARAEAQSRVDAIYDKFTAALSKNLDISPATVRKDFGEGRVLSAEKALSVGMAHRVMPFESLILKLTGGKQQKVNGPSAEKLLALHEHEESEE